jgi:hypothetical protein
MNVNDMKLGVRYNVTHPSVNEEFQTGDRIRLLENGDILNITAGGWMEVEDVPLATEGMEIEIDQEWLQKQRQDIQNKLGLLQQL